MAVRTTVKRHFSIKVPKKHETAVRDALERWAHSKGWAAAVKAEREDDYVKFSLEHDESMAGKPPDIEAGGMTDELQRVIQDAIKA